MADFCPHCDDSCAIPVYLGGGYSGVARCNECAKSHWTVSVSHTDKRTNEKHVEMVHRVMRGLVSFRHLLGRPPKSYRDEWRKVQELQDEWAKDASGFGPTEAYPNGKPFVRYET